MQGLEPYSLWEDLYTVVIHRFVGCPPRVMGILTLSRICPFYQSQCGSFFMSLIVEDLFWSFSSMAILQIAMILIKCKRR